MLSPAHTNHCNFHTNTFVFLIYFFHLLTLERQKDSGERLRQAGRPGGVEHSHEEGERYNGSDGAHRSCRAAHGCRNPVGDPCRRAETQREDQPFFVQMVNCIMSQ